MHREPEARSKSREEIEVRPRAIRSTFLKLFQFNLFLKNKKRTEKTN